MTTATEQPLLLTTKDLQVLLRLGRTATYDITRRADFPKIVPIGKTVYRWYATDVYAWLDAQHLDERPTRAARREPEPASGVQEPLFTVRASKRRRVSA